MIIKTAVSILSTLVLLTLIGCDVNSIPSGEATRASPALPAKSGAQLWSENCSRCHNLRAPQSYNDAQWAAVVHHMRLRADLEGGEARLIAEFLQASH